MTAPYTGLSADEFADIHESVMEALAYVMLPVIFERVKTSTTGTDPLYGEATGGREDMPALPPIPASVKLSPHPESLTRYGLQTDADVLLFIPKNAIVAWEAANLQTFLVTDDMTLTYQNVLYNVTETRKDVLPVDDGTTSDYIGLVVTATTKPNAG